MKLYKYVSGEDAVKSIVSGNIKFTEIDKLNDPTELLPSFNRNELIESLKSLRKNGCSEADLCDLKIQAEVLRTLVPDFKSILDPRSVDEVNTLLKSAKFNDIDNLIKFAQYVRSVVVENCGLLCLSTRFDSLPMWAHYADNAKGFVVELSNLNELYKDEGFKILDQIKKVNYVKRKTFATFYRGICDSVFLEKDIDWSYENEYRIVSKLNSNGLEYRKGMYCKCIDKKYITKVIFGWNYSKEDESKIHELSNEVKNLNSNVDCVRADVTTGLVILQ